MRVEIRDLSELRPDPGNARLHPEPNLRALVESLRSFGQQRAAVIRDDGTVIAGSGMLEAARRLGWTNLTVTVVPADWTDDECRAFALADNKVGLLAEWDTSTLDAYLYDLNDLGVDMTRFGFDPVTVETRDVDEAFDAVPDGDRPDATQMTFTLTLQQAEVVKAAISAAYDSRAGEVTGNSNGNGNALARICTEWFDGS